MELIFDSRQLGYVLLSVPLSLACCGFFKHLWWMYRRDRSTFFKGSFNLFVGVCTLNGFLLSTDAAISGGVYWINLPLVIAFYVVLGLIISERFRS